MQGIKLKLFLLYRNILLFHSLTEEGKCLFEVESESFFLLIDVLFVFFFNKFNIFEYMDNNVYI